MEIFDFKEQVTSQLTHNGRACRSIIISFIVLVDEKFNYTWMQLFLLLFKFLNLQALYLSSFVGVKKHNLRAPLTSVGLAKASGSHSEPEICVRRRIAGLLTIFRVFKAIVDNRRASTRLQRHVMNLRKTRGALHVRPRAPLLMCAMCALYARYTLYYICIPPIRNLCRGPLDNEEPTALPPSYNLYISFYPELGLCYANSARGSMNWVSLKGMRLVQHMTAQPQCCDGTKQRRCRYHRCHGAAWRVMGLTSAFTCHSPILVRHHASHASKTRASIRRSLVPRAELAVGMKGKVRL